MQDMIEAGKAVQEGTDAGQAGCRIGRMQDRTDAGEDGCRRGRMQDRIDAGQMLEWTDSYF